MAVSMKRGRKVILVMTLLVILTETSAGKSEKISDYETKPDTDSYAKNYEYKISLSEGETLSIRCRTPEYGNVNHAGSILWKSAHKEALAYGHEVITDDYRIKVYGDILKIYNVTYEDEGVYSCTHRSGPTYDYEVKISRVYCYTLNDISHSTMDYHPHEAKNSDKVKYGTKAVYQCKSGYTLVGTPVRYCTKTGWTGKEPSCERGYVFTLEARMYKMEEYLEEINFKLSSSQDEIRNLFSLLEFIMNDYHSFRVKTEEELNKADVELKSLRLALVTQRYSMYSSYTYPNSRLLSYYRGRMY